MTRITLTGPALAMTSCATVLPEPAVYHAIGTEPGWSLDIGERTMRFSGPTARNRSAN